MDVPTRAAGRGDEEVVDRLVAEVRRAGDVPTGVWRRDVLGCLAEVSRLLTRDRATPADWLDPRRAHVVRQRTLLVDRVELQRMQVLGSHDLDRLTGELTRLAEDVRHHLQHEHDLAYDEVEYEVGGSE